MDLSKIFDFQSKAFSNIYKISPERLKEIHRFLHEPLSSSAMNGDSTLDASVNFFDYISSKNLSDNELLYLSFIAGAGYNDIIRQAKNFKNNAESI